MCPIHFSGHFVLLSAWQVAELREELKKLGEKTTGRKAELVERLQAFVRRMLCDAVPDESCLSTFSEPETLQPQAAQPSNAS